MNRRDALQRTAMILGYAVSAPALAGILKGCKPTGDSSYQPMFLTKTEAALVADVAEIIMPKTTTPGAKDVGVPAFIDTMLKEGYSKVDQDRFRKGAAEFNEGAKKAYGSDFIDCDKEQQMAFVKEVHDQALNAPTPEKPFILMTKELTLLGFFTSEAGATQVLQYKPVPGPYRGCVPLTEVGKTWAT